MLDKYLKKSLLTHASQTSQDNHTPLHHATETALPTHQLLPPRRVPNYAECETESNFAPRPSSLAIFLAAQASCLLQSLYKLNMGQKRWITRLSRKHDKNCYRKMRHGTMQCSKWEKQECPLTILVHLSHLAILWPMSKKVRAMVVRLFVHNPSQSRLVETCPL